MRRKLGPYHLLERLGSGAMGEVFVATEGPAAPKVAVKVLSRTAAEDRQVVARFLQEARILAALEHPGIVRILRCEELPDGEVYLAMEYLEGVTLRAWLENLSDAPAFETVLAITCQIANAMAEVHECGVVHRDLKPENIFLLSDEEQPRGYRAKIIDFGIAKAPRTAEGSVLNTRIDTRNPVLLGTVQYMAPEQCSNPADVSDRADVYAFGLILFEMLARRPPFAADSSIEIMARHMKEQPPHLLEFVPDAPALLGALIDSMLTKEPTQRPSMRRVQERLERRWETENAVARSCPLPGLRWLTDDHAELFFGRDREVRELSGLLGRVHAAEHRWLMIEGASGTGKTSLVQAGLLPMLREEDHLVLPRRWRIACMRPGDDPIDQLARALADMGSRHEEPWDSSDELAEQLRSHPDRLLEIGSELSDSNGVLLIVIEQMEDLFAADERMLRHFDALLSRALSSKSSPVRLLTTLRSDFVHRLQRLPLLSRVFESALRFTLHTMEEDALTAVVHGLVRRIGLELADGLAERIAHDAAGSSSPLPLLGHTLYSLWRPRPGRLTHEDYESHGAVSGVLTQQIDRLLEDLGDRALLHAKWLILALVEVGRGVPDKRRSRSRDELLRAAGGDALARTVLQRFVGDTNGTATSAAQPLRLLLSAGQPSPETSYDQFELAHDALLQRVPRIVAWLDEERSRLERQADVEAAASAWEQSGAPTDGLPSGTLLKHFCGSRRDRHQGEIFTRLSSPRARSFVAAAGRLEARGRWTRRMLVSLLVLALVAAMLSAFQARREQRRAEDSRQQALRAESRAQATRRHALVATEEIVSEADWILARFHHTLKVREDTLLHLHKNLISLPESERDLLEVRIAIIKTSHRLGDLSLDFQTLAQADERYTDAANLLRDSVRWQDRREVIELSALNHSKLGKLSLARGDWPSAREDFGKSLRLLHRMGAATGNEGDIRTLAVSTEELGDLEMAVGRPDLAVKHYAESLSLMEQHPDDYDRSLRTEALCHHARAARESRDWKGAARSLEKALTMQVEVVRANPGYAYYRYALAFVYIEMTALLLEQQEFDEATKYDQEGLDLATALNAKDPQHKRYALLLARGLRVGETLAQRQGDGERAHALREKRCALSNEFVRRDPEDVRFQALTCP